MNAAPRRIIVCGTREGIRPRELVPMALDMFCYRYLTPDLVDNLHVIAGSRRGVDRQALEWAEEHELISTCVAAKWFKFGKAGGPKRNRRMLDLFSPWAVLAFPGGDGTADMISATKECMRSSPWGIDPPLLFQCAIDFDARTMRWIEVSC